MRTKAFLPMAVVGLFAASLFAQRGTPPTPAQMVANRVARLTTLLSLTSAQQTSATNIFTTEETAQATPRSSLAAARKALETAVEANDANAITTAATQIGTLTTEEVQARAQADAAFYAILTADQQAKFKQLEGPGGFGPGGGPGGHGGPRPPDSGN